MSGWPYWRRCVAAAPFGGGAAAEAPKGLANLDDEELKTLRRLTVKAGADDGRA